MPGPIPRLLAATFCAALIAAAQAATPSVEHAFAGAGYSLRWGVDAQIADATFSLNINGEWVYGDAFPQRVRPAMALHTYFIESFRFLIDATDGKASNQFPGWPVIIHQAENRGENRLD